MKPVPHHSILSEGSEYVRIYAGEQLEKKLFNIQMKIGSKVNQFLDPDSGKALACTTTVYPGGLIFLQFDWLIL